MRRIEPEKDSPLLALSISGPHGKEYEQPLVAETISQQGNRDFSATASGN